MSPNEIAGADNDAAARLALWQAICRAGEDVRNRFKVGAIVGIGGLPLRQGANLPDVATWQLVEALSLLCVILRCEEAEARTIGVFGKSGPIEISEEGVVRYLWAQHAVRGDWSALDGRPDLIVTSSSQEPHPENALRVVEAKCVKNLGTQTIRSEFGKAYDLRVATYFIWTFYTPSPRVVDGARGLGIDLEALGFDSARREDLLKSPEALISHVAHAQEEARQTQRFTAALEGAVDQARRKLFAQTEALE